MVDKAIGHASIPVNVSYEFRCPETGHVVPVHELNDMPTGTALEGTYTVYDDKGRALAKGDLSDLVHAGTAEPDANSEDS